MALSTRSKTILGSITSLDNMSSRWYDFLPGIDDPSSILTDMMEDGPCATAKLLNQRQMEAMKALLQNLPQMATTTTGAIGTTEKLLNAAGEFVNKIMEVIKESPVQNGLLLPAATPYSRPPNPHYQPLMEETVRKMKPILHRHLREIPIQEEEARIPKGLLGRERSSVKHMPIAEEEKILLLTKAEEPPKYSKSIEQQNKKVLSLYQTFTEQMNLEPFPLTSVSVVAFLMWLASTKQYCAKTLDDIIFSSLCRLEILHSHQHIDPYVSSCARAKLSEFYRDTSLKPSGEGMTPLIPDDVSRIIQAMPRQASSTAKWASLFLLALATGARGSTCSSIRVLDIISERTGVDGISLVGINLVRLKSRPGEVFEVTLAGYPEVYNPMDVLYWINRYLNQSFGISLHAVTSARDSIKEVILQRKLWPLSTDSMREGLKRKMENAGLNPKGYGFHSFRSGFLAACLSVGAARGLSLHDRLIRSALLAGWKAGSTVQLNYIKKDTRANIVATNEIGITDTPTRTLPPTFAPPTSLRQKNASGNYPLYNSVEFHRGAPAKQPPPRARQSFASEVLQALKPLIWVSSASDAANNSYATTCYKWGLVRLARDVLGEEAWHWSYSSLRKEGIQIVNKRLQEDPDCAKTIASEIVEKLKANDRLKSELKEPKPPPIYKCKGPDRQFITTLTGGVQRKRIDWSVEEEAILQQGVETGLSSKEIADKLYIRTPEDVRLHLRFINRKRSQSVPPLPPLKLPDSRCRKKSQKGVSSSSAVPIPTTSSSTSSPESTDDSFLSMFESESTEDETSNPTSDSTSFLSDFSF